MNNNCNFYNFYTEVVLSVYQTTTTQQLGNFEMLNRRLTSDLITRKAANDFDVYQQNIDL